MHPSLQRSIVASLLLASACAPAQSPGGHLSPAPAAAPPAATTAVRPAGRGVPVPAAYRAAVDAGTRSASGAPGSRYWQQRVRYRIEAELDPQSTELRGSERIVYQNQSPDTLRSVVLNLYQNVFAQGVPRNRYVPITGGFALERVVAQGQALQERTAQQIPVTSEPRAGTAAGYAVQGTLGRIALPRPILPGDSAVLEIGWTHRVPPAPSFRTGWEDALGGRAFQVAQWYPQIAAYDDLRGWDATPYLGDGEFYLEYGDFDVTLTLPQGYLVGATGLLQNPDEVLTPEVRARLAASARSDSITHVVTEADLAAGGATRSAPDGRLSWHFRAENVRDFGFATSERYLWDATRASASGPDGARDVAVHALYRPGAPHWTLGARFGQHSIDFFGQLLIPYLYPQITVAEGPIGGMEYPQLVFIGRPGEEIALESVIAHEVGHEWFPMMVGSDEAAHPWMDEGFTTFHEGLARGDFYRIADPFEDDVDRYLAVAGTEREVSLMRHTDLVSPYGARGVAAYQKPGVLLRSLRGIVGDSVLDRAMRTYAREWLLKHPAPWDFFRTVERVSGRDLDWFFHPWWFETGVLDHAIQEVRGTGESVIVTVRNEGDNPAPTVVVVTTASGAVHRGVIPAETWLAGTRVASVSISLGEPAARVELDPEEIYLDADRGDNVWVAPGSR